MMLVKKIWSKILDFFVPPVCIYCRKRVQDAYAICSECFQKISFLDEPCCDDCGAPLCYENSICTYCLGTLENKKHYDKLRAIFNYDDFSKMSILALKHGDAAYVAKFFANLMYARYKKIFEEADVILYVPIHFKRLLKRHYNQAALIARVIGQRADKKVSHGNLIRVKNTKAQQGDMRSRKRNVKNAFKVKNPELLQGLSVVLIDDVFTTGATLNECSRVLKESGVLTVICCTMARAFQNVTVKF